MMSAAFPLARKRRDRNGLQTRAARAPLPLKTPAPDAA